MTAAFVNLLGAWFLTLILAIGKYWLGSDIPDEYIVGPAIAVNCFYGVALQWRRLKERIKRL